MKLPAHNPDRGVKVVFLNIRGWIILIVLTVLFSSCGEGRPPFVGDWKSEDGITLNIKEIDNGSYDVKIYLSNTNIANKYLSGAYNYDSKEKGIIKATNLFPGPIPNSDKSMIAIRYDHGKLYINGNYNDVYFTRQ